MEFPSNSQWFIDVDDDVIKKIYTLTETTLEELKKWEPDPLPAVYHNSAEFPENTSFVRYPNNQPPKQPGGYLSVLAQDLDSVVNSARGYNIAITFFKGEKNLQEEAKDKSNSEKAQLENKEFLKNFKEEVEQLLAGIEYFESLNNRIQIEMMKKVVAASDAPEWSKDNIFTLDVMEEPVTANDGFTYEKANILAWFGTNNTSPTTGAVIRKELTPNYSLKSHINQWSEAQAKSVKEKHRYGIEFLKNDEILQKLRTRLNELRTINEGIFKKYETVPSWNDLIKPSLPVNRSKLRKLLFGQTNPDNLNAGGKKGSTRTTRKTRKRNVRGRRRTNNRRHLHRRNAKK